MGNTRSKLKVHLDPSFLPFFLDKYEGEHEYFLLSFTKKVFESGCCEVVDLSGERYTNIELLAFIARLRNLKDRKHVIRREIDNGSTQFNLDALKGKTSNLVLIEVPSEQIEEISRTTGVLTSNSDQIKGKFLRLCLNNESYDSSRDFNIGPSNSDILYSQFAEVSLPTKSITIVDPYIGTWSTRKFRENLIPLIQNLFMSGIPAHRVHITIISKVSNKEQDWLTIPTDFIENNLRLNEFEKCPYTNNRIRWRVKCTPQNIGAMLVEVFNNISCRILFYDQESIEREIRNTISNRNLIPLKNKIKEHMHDRLIFSDYFYGISGRSFDYRIYWDYKKLSHAVRNRTVLNLKSVLFYQNDANFFDEMLSFIEDLNELRKNETYSNFFLVEEF